jgi:hypothetical protein
LSNALATRAGLLAEVSASADDAGQQALEQSPMGNNGRAASRVVATAIARRRSALRRNIMLI